MISLRENIKICWFTTISKIDLNQIQNSTILVWIHGDLIIHLIIISFHIIWPNMINIYLGNQLPTKKFFGDFLSLKKMHCHLKPIFTWENHYCSRRICALKCVKLSRAIKKKVYLLVQASSRTDHVLSSSQTADLERRGIMGLKPRRQSYCICSPGWYLGLGAPWSLIVSNLGGSPQASRNKENKNMKIK